MHEGEEEERKESSISLKVAHVHCLSVKQKKECSGPMMKEVFASL